MKNKLFHRNTILLILLLFFGSLEKTNAHQKTNSSTFLINNSLFSSEHLDYDFIILNATHDNSLPENPAERTEKDEDEKEGNDELNGDEIEDYFNPLSLFVNDTFSNKILVHDGVEIIPFYILFHSWKSFLPK